MENTQNKKEIGGGRRETIIALIICAVVLLLPIFVIEHEYKVFTKEHGVAKEGAAGAGLWLAVMFRTVSRTVLRTIIRTSARAGMRASLRGAFRTGIRSAGRTTSKKLADQNLPVSENKGFQQNLKSLCFASVLLYVSWVIVIGLGQPYSGLLYKSSEELVLAKEDQTHKNRIVELQELAVEAWEREQDWKETRSELRVIERKIKMERNAPERAELNKRESFLRQKELLDARAFEDAYSKSKKEKLNPKYIKDLSEEEEEEHLQRITWLQTLAPYPAEPVAGTSFSVELRDVESQGKVLEPIRYLITIDAPSLDIPHDLDVSHNDGEFALSKIKPSPNLLNWVQLREGVSFHFSQEVDSIGEVVVDSDSVSIHRVQLGVDEVVIQFGGRTPWKSMVIWLGGFIVVLPLWLIYFFQSWKAKKEGLVLNHETGPIGGGIQLYFAGAFSFMPLTSDVEVPQANPAQRSLIALYGLLPPAVISVFVWFLWLQIGDSRLLFLSDALLIFPMVQCFPLSPLEGIYVWRYSKLQWFCTFVFIMSLFMIVASAGLKGVI
ncbi:MAG: hypothetical protein CL916_03560 [Deltaproteobacteria bacterium]|nr:hypothetical protein [Deltaproteobacteria bacterium]